MWRRRTRRTRPVTSTAKRLAATAANALEALEDLPASPEREALREAAISTLEELLATGPVLFEAAAHEPHLAEARHSALEDVVTEATKDLLNTARLNRQVLVLKQELEAADERVSRLKGASASARADTSARLDSTTLALAELESISLEVRSASPDRRSGTLA